MKTKTTILLALLIVGTLFATTMVSAYKGDYNIKGPDYTEERHDAMQTAFAELDYETWYNLMTATGRVPKVAAVVTKDNFKQFVAAHDAALAGDMQTASDLRAELGLHNGVGSEDGMGFKQGANQGKRQQQESKGNRQQGQNCVLQ